jgi:hypothetical protein
MAIAPALSEMSRGQVHHQQAAIGVHSDMTLAPDDLLVRVTASRVGEWCFNGLAVDHGGSSGLIRSHSSSVKSVGYRLVFRAISAIRPRLSASTSQA